LFSVPIDAYANDQRLHPLFTAGIGCGAAGQICTDFSHPKGGNVTNSFGYLPSGVPSVSSPTPLPLQMLVSPSCHV